MHTRYAVYGCRLVMQSEITERRSRNWPEQLGGLANCGSVLKLELEPVMASGAEITQKKYEKELL